MTTCSTKRRRWRRARIDFISKTRSFSVLRKRIELVLAGTAATAACPRRR